MAKQDLEKRVENIEETLTLLNTLPARVGGVEARLGSLETQFLQFRTEVRGEFSAIRTELRGEMQHLHEAAKAHAGVLQKETMAYVRVLHEALVEQIKTLGSR